MDSAHSRLIRAARELAAASQAYDAELEKAAARARELAEEALAERVQRSTDPAPPAGSNF